MHRYHLCMQVLLDGVRQLLRYDSASLPPPSIITTLIHALSLVIPLTPIRTGVAGWGVAQHEPRRHVRRRQR